MNGIQFLRLIGDARAFRQAAWMIENEIHRLKARQGNLSPIGGSSGWPSHNVWESLKTASHYNLGVSLELRLKCLLHLHDVDPLGGHDGHCLAKLFAQLRESDSATKAKLERLFRQAKQDHPFNLVAFLSTDTPDIPNGPPQRPLDTLSEFFKYMDDDVELRKKGTHGKMRRLENGSITLMILADFLHFLTQRKQWQRRWHENGVLFID